MSRAILTSILLLAASWSSWEQAAAPPSPSSERIRIAEKRVEKDSSSAALYVELAAALCRKARDTEDPDLYDRAAVAVDRAFKIAPGDYDARKVNVTVLLGRHQFAKALDAAKNLNRTTPDDLAVWALLVDANIALGEYPEAERDAQWVLDLRRGNTVGFIKAAQLREWFGDPEGAGEFYYEALRRTSMNDLDERAWLYTQNARMQISLGNFKNAAGLIEEARKADGQSLFTATTLAHLRTLEGQYAEAASLLEARYRAVPSLTNLYDYAEAMDRAGKPDDAAVLFQEFETKAPAESSNPNNANKQLVFYYADRKHAPEQALAVARREIAIRHDVPTLDAYAWALYQAHQAPDAKAQMDRVLRVGIRDPAIYCRAVRIAQATGDPKGAQHLQTVLQGLGPGTCPADAALATGAKGRLE
jgi:tetratricopeptide (TPR) repeat protein